MAQMLNARLTLLPAPGLVDSAQVRDVFLSDSHVRKAREMFPQITLAFLGIGAASPTAWIMQNHVLTPEQLELLRQRGAVGETALRFFDAHGDRVASPLDDRIIGITLDELKRVPRVVGMAGGPQKHEVVRAALRGQLIDVLITDQHMARLLLEDGPGS
jgi:DNA-binding transcriptional regulator LsrR (DeoR family)